MKRVLKLLGKCIVALLPLWLICIFIAERPLAYLSADSIGAYWNKDFTSTKQDENYDVVILGDSMAATSFMPELLSDSTINLALSGSSPVEGYYTLKEYLTNNESPSDVFVCYMDYHLAHDDFTLSTCNQVHKFSFGDYIEIYRTIKGVGANNFEDIQMSEYWEKAIASCFFMPSEYIASIINSIKEGGRYEENKESYDSITINAGRNCHMTNDVSESSGIKYSDFTVSALQGTYYKKLVDLCGDNGIKLHIIKLPLDNYTVFTDEYQAKVNGYYMTLLDGVEGAEFKWYPADYAREWFWDDYHMNQHGSFRFSMQLKTDYPDLFGDYTASANQMLSLNNDLNIENELGEIFKWVDQKDYTVLLYNGQKLDDFTGMFNAYLKYNNQELMDIHVDDIIVVNGIHGNARVSVTSDGDSYTVECGGNEYTWTPEANKLGLLVIDEKNGTIVIQRSTSFNDGEQPFEKLY